MMKHYLTKFFQIFFMTTALAWSIGCTSNASAPDSEKTGSNKPGDKDETTAPGLVKGADVSWLMQMEQTGYKFYDSDGKEADCLDILQENGINAIRLRVFVNPSDNPQSGHCSTAETVLMAKRCLAKGFRLMIDFHYSDTWADPGHQLKPAAWKDHDFETLLKDVYDYTYHVLDTLKSEGCQPDWVQIGNEITGGMLWPTGSTDNWPQLAQLLNQGYSATKSVSDQIQVIVHIDQGNNQDRTRWFYDSATIYKVSYDIVGLSYYPYWLEEDYTESIEDLASNLNDIVSRYQKPVMIVETGGADTAVDNTYDMLRAVINTTAAVNQQKGLGVFYWEPEGARSWSRYKLSCWGEDGRPTRALSAFK